MAISFFPLFDNSELSFRVLPEFLLKFQTKSFITHTHGHVTKIKAIFPKFV